MVRVVHRMPRIIAAIKSKSGRAKLDEVNRVVNAAIRYVSDYARSLKDGVV
jgi:hypothetical protein